MPRIIAGFFCFDLGLCLLYLASHAFGGRSNPLYRLLDLAAEGNPPTWYAAIQWFLVAMLLMLFCFRRFRRSEPVTWPFVLLASVFLAFSVDEVAKLHESLGALSDRWLPGGSRKNTLFGKTGVWMFLIGVPFILLFSFLMHAVWNRFRAQRPALFKIALGVTVLLVGALGLESLYNFVPKGGSPWGISEVFLEEVLEMLGATLTLWGVYELAEIDELLAVYTAASAGRHTPAQLPPGLAPVRASEESGRIHQPVSFIR